MHLTSGPKVWPRDKLPLLYTPINCHEILQTRFLTVSFQITQGTFTTSDNFAYATIDLKDLKSFPNSNYQADYRKQQEEQMRNNPYKNCHESDDNWDHFLTVSNAQPPAVGSSKTVAHGKLICHNCEIGHVDLTLLYRMRGQTVFKPEEMQEQMAAIEMRNTQIATALIKSYRES